MVIARRAAWSVGWVATVALAVFAGWLVGQRFWPPESHRVLRSPLEQETNAGEATLPQGFQVPPGTVMPEPAAVEPEPEPPVIEQKPQLPPPVAEPELVPEIVVEEPVEVVEVTEPAIVITDGFARAGELAEVGDFDGARVEAETLLAEYGDYSGLIDAFLESGDGETRARLNALRVLQLGGLQMISVEVARELKRSYAGSAEVLESIHDWRILKPSVARLDSSIEEGRGVVVQGRVSNPDVGVVRRVIVEVEALDAGGNVLAKTTARVRPRALDAGAAGSFTAEFPGIDPASVLRTRATVVKWQSEVFE
ncbi:MAG: hypothetical protein GTO30_15090 [Acidobacteria bacterium]|nr:hypothetical protein [Acidobacteriota bacterium]NIM62914.1 hypothetical protein [Acidobacteriota bacterium]NIO60779.1 hypothetical protein [Acidobacteriota bacterium]NIQ87194.1 hypothetical protein [Acidobacteriota bacterium]NIT12445.1 hypothetical protein [Acidobacteriota bacterium]